MATPSSTPVDTPDENPDTTTKKKRGPNWLPREEEQLAISWINVSEQPEFATNQSGETFYRRIEQDFNTHSKAHYRDRAQIKTRWTAMNTATLKFSAIYNAIKQNPPSGSSPEDWLEAAKTNYQEQTKGTAFNALSAWQKLRYAPKWQADPRVIQPSTPTPLDPQTDPTGSPTETPITGVCTPSSRLASSISRPIGGKAAKRRRIEGYRDDEMMSQANEFVSISQDRLLSLNQANDILKAKNEILREKMKIEEKKLELEEKKVSIEEEHRRSETQMNDYKLLRETEEMEEDETKEVLRIMKDEIKKKWRARA
ncbi:hypothetical protein PGT21_050038 [Puccinia graminis f. sp. tritici]|uniref:No apical meristem-associated C-terminal domain-containing protein n=1 Tax=Puccinia graminis f. sp. tritici TaxID=56615 RepID=A0A5B0QIX2_PUCGR|nr:hypothetical protein PGT21_050038 [Puccinia graminis f. sp. tritici]